MIVLSILMVAVVMCLMVRLLFTNLSLRVIAYLAVAIITVPMLNIDYTESPTLSDIANAIIWAATFNVIFFSWVGRIVCGAVK